MKCPKCKNEEFEKVTHNGTYNNDLSYTSYKCVKCGSEIWKNIWTGKWELIE